MFADEGGVGARMAAALTGLGYRAVIVEPGAAFAKVSADRYTVAPAERSDYTALMRDLNNQGAAPVAVAHLWMLTRLGERGAVAPRAYEDRGFYSLIGLAQAIGELGIASPMRIGRLHRRRARSDGTGDAAAREGDGHRTVPGDSAGVPEYRVPAD